MFEKRNPIKYSKWVITVKWLTKIDKPPLFPAKPKVASWDRNICRFSRSPVPTWGSILVEMVRVRVITIAVDVLVHAAGRRKGTRLGIMTEFCGKLVDSRKRAAECGKIHHLLYWWTATFILVAHSFTNVLAQITVSLLYCWHFNTYFYATIGIELAIFVHNFLIRNRDNANIEAAVCTMGWRNK